jgi:hypothetical protein
MTMKNLIFLFSFLFLISCTNVPTKTYTVKAGKHRSTNKITILKKDAISYQFSTNDTWIWQTPQNNGWSKVLGIGWGSNHKNSVRIVYRMLNDSIGALGYYYYVNGVSPMQNNNYWGILDTITVSNVYAGRLGWENGYYFISLNDKFHSIKIDKPTGIKNLQHPYIGGTYTINHDWTTTQKIW